MIATYTITVKWNGTDKNDLTNMMKCGFERSNSIQVVYLKEVA